MESLSSPFPGGEILGIENAVDALGHPLRIEHVGISKACIVFVVERNTKTMQVRSKRLLRFRINLVILRTYLPVAVEGEVVFRHAGEPVLDGEPCRRKSVAQVGKAVGLPPDRLVQHIDPCTVGAVGFDKLANVGKFPDQPSAIDGERMLAGLVEDNNHRRIRGETVDQIEPIFGVGFLVTLTAVEHQQIQAPLSHKELVGGVHDLLAAEVPDMQAHLLIVQRDRPLGNFDALGFSLPTIEGIVNEPIDQRRLANAAKSHKNQLGFIEGPLSTAGSKVVVENFCRLGRFGVFLDGVFPAWPEYLPQAV